MDLKTKTCIVAEGQVTKNIEGDNQVKKYTPSVNLNLIMTYMANKPSHPQQISIVQWTITCEAMALRVLSHQDVMHNYGTMI